MKVIKRHLQLNLFKLIKVIGCINENQVTKRNVY